MNGPIQNLSATVPACDTVLASVTAYNHSSAESWNSEIISSTLTSLLAATTPADGAQPPYKYSITSTIIQHLPQPSTTSSPTQSTPRRGMHAAAGAYWDNTRDGMWSYKYEAAQGKGLDVVVAVIWIWVGYGTGSAGAGEEGK
ncbi:hypothetical protein EPUS_06980 [Endocarpon pusillum Z07020]|uniref:Topoisomerase I damage affected protein 2 n=1 Tax=Endocarpon pusillum (strain Z07020 / HMAS-L-300199) TaxID=1263415 RepID=U1GSR3_ENDPU|nr:uncharacterized protein EPUS_06980 [Endocarpon pusillum Z07020]ERF75448.1 hypothetical protein EPUS_06980 [Endocarpon pusillum Z07020]